jgi:hypothetical protein
MAREVDGGHNISTRPFLRIIVNLEFCSRQRQICSLILTQKKHSRRISVLVSDGHVQHFYTTLTFRLTTYEVTQSLEGARLNKAYHLPL